MAMAMLIVKEAASTRYLPGAPRAPAPPPPTVESAVVPISANPAVISSNTLRPRALNGFGR